MNALHPVIPTFGAKDGAPGPASVVPAGLIALIALALMIALNPSGYRGGGLDDFHYLEAARCAVANGVCAPQTHWAARMPLILPMASVIALFGEGRVALGLVPLAYALAALLLLVRLVAGRFGARAGALAGLALVATPAFGGTTLQPGIDLPELAFLLAAAACLSRALRPGPARAWAVGAGVALALAAQCRPSALCALPLMLALLFWRPSFRRLAAPFLLGLASPLLGEAAIYAVATGDPATPWRLALAHGRIPSTELAPHVDLSRSPLFNPQFIGGWTPASGIAAHWTLSGIVNLVAHPAIGPVLLAAFALAMLGRPHAPDRMAWLLVAAGALYFGGIVYALGIDPKPRMFLPVAAAAAAVVGIEGDRLRRRGGWLPIVALIAVLTSAAAFMVAANRDLRVSDRLAAAWIAQEGPVGMDPTTARALALVPGLRDGGAGAPARLFLGDRTCEAALRDGSPGWRIARAAPIPTTLDRLAGRPPRDGLTLCLFRRDRAEAPGS